MNVSNVDELIDYIKSHKVVIYGAGYVAKRFYQSLKSHKLDGKVECFITTNGGENDVEDKKNIAIDKFKYDSSYMVCVAVHESIKDEIIEILEAKNITNYIWIYPFQYEIMLGQPIERSVKIPVKNIVKRAVEYYGMAIRNIAIGQYYGKNDIGYEMYIKAQSLHCNENTAKKRLEQFIGLIESWEKNGYDESKELLVTDDYAIIDGSHRASLAIYHNQKFIMGSIYGCSKELFQIHDEGGMLTKNYIASNGFTAEEIKLLEETNKKIEEMYSCE